jgi:hypothetical protein
MDRQRRRDIHLPKEPVAYILTIMMRIASTLACIFVFLALSACSELRQDLGLGRNPPDEFAVVDQPPLSMPPDFDLRPPQPGAPRPQGVDMKQRASEILFGGVGEKTVDTAELSAVEKSLLEKSGGDKANPDIKQVVERESTQRIVGTQHLVDDLLWWKKDAPPGTIVDAAAEAARIKDAKDKGDNISTGATPVIERQKSGWLGL